MNTVMTESCLCTNITQEPLSAFSIDYSQIHKVQAVRALCVLSALHLPGVDTLTLCVHSSTPAVTLDTADL